ncbi:TetR/AcrR family transcriptional regulator [Synechococcus sp. PCC 7336]|uniref:TetR/AcrR family transcriptional regulator n=1 Tax=Synechococcus sp. PCC 7336 TaxID=195250 RepID=UPI00034D6466|nr:TetR/AcrR family transcriptional regulator [Synechococcus sp. PCC 7336]
MASRGQETKELILANTEALVLERGFAGTSIDEILKLTGLTKGAFFYHFKSKAALARALVERYWQQDYAMLEEFSRRADELSEDPLQSMLIFLKLFEEFIEGLEEPPAGCVFASYVYEFYQFDDGIKQFIADGFKQWGKMYQQRIEKIAAKYPPKIAIDAGELAETLMCIIEGGFILSKSLCDTSLTARTVRQFRRHLQLVFEP